MDLFGGWVKTLTVDVTGQNENHTPLPQRQMKDFAYKIFRAKQLIIKTICQKRLS